MNITQTKSSSCLPMENAETELRLGLPGEEKGREIFGWPPLRSYRWKVMVKVSMDGVPFLRKIALGDYGDYDQLLHAIQQLFASYFIGKEVIKCDYVPIYEDKDGDWMLVGDVPWKIFAASCTRLRIMKRKDSNDESQSLYLYNN